MWTRIVGSLVVLIIISFAIQWIAPRSMRGSGRARQYLLWDVISVVGFFGIVLLILSAVEAERQGYLLAWGGVVQEAWSPRRSCGWA